MYSHINRATLPVHNFNLMKLALILIIGIRRLYNGVNASGTIFCRSAAPILMALLLLRHAVFITDNGSGDGDGIEDASAFFSLLLLRAVGFLLPCYIRIWIINILQCRRQRQEAAAALAAARFSIVVQAAQRRGLLMAPASASSRANPHLEQI